MKIKLTYKLIDPCCNKMSQAIDSGAAELLSAHVGEQPPCISTMGKNGWHPWLYCPWCGEPVPEEIGK